MPGSSVNTVNLQSHFKLLFSITLNLLLGVLFLGLLGCKPGNEVLPTIEITIQVDGKQISSSVTAGSTVQTALGKAGITLNTLDRIDPPGYTPITSKTNIRITRIRESFEVKDVIIPFQRQTVRNESLPEGQTLLIQPGTNGSQQITYRHVFENDIEVSSTSIKTVTISEARPEIVMVGVQTPFTAVPIPGKIVYLTASNAWIMENSTGERRPLVTSGDLDGYIFTLSAEGKWLLFTRKADKSSTDVINALWAVDVTNKSPKPINLRINNVIHYAEWVPESGLTITYSTVEARPTAPGWQANNDLNLLTFNPEGVTIKKVKIVEANSGGIYGWWGTTFAWSPDGEQIAYVRPDSIGMVDIKKGKLNSLLDLIPLQTRSDWAWVPGIGWAQDNINLYTVTHVPKSGLASNEASPLFDLTAIVTAGGPVLDIVQQSGMFAYPAPSPFLQNKRYKVAFLQAIFPEQSETSRYKLMLMDRDSSNKEALFPPEGAQGLDAQKVVWGPNNSGDNPPWLAFNYQGNLWLLNSDTRQAQQITGDGSISRLDWK
jgi:hypothetical protein